MFHEPRSLEELWGVLERPGPRVFVAGGTDLMPAAKDFGVPPEAAFISLMRLEEARGITLEKGTLRIGALCTHEEIRTSPLVADNAPALADAAGRMASPPVRNRGTIGGNLATSSPAGDLIPPLFVHDAAVVIASRRGARKAPVSEFATGVKKNVLEPDEIIVRVEIPAGGRISAFRKIGPRRAMAVSKASAAFSAIFRGGIVTSVRVALGAVAPMVIRSPAAEKIMEGRVPADVIIEAGLAAARDARPIDDFRSDASYRRKAIAALLEDAVAAAMQRAEKSGRKSQP